VGKIAVELIKHFTL